MKVGLFTDPHLGLVRTAHTTVESRRALRAELFDRTMKAVETLREEGADVVYCLGDLFDTYANDEAVLLQGHTVLTSIDGCLAGNHDIANRTDKVGTLQALSTILTDSTDCAIWINPQPSEPCFLNQHSGWVVIPHALTQELFCKSLDDAIEWAIAMGTDNGRKPMLCLHCNVGVPGHSEASADGTSLYLTDEYQTKVLEHFQYVFVGHEHPPRTLHDDRIVLLGNVHPIAFGEIADRYAYIVDDGDMTVRAIKIFSMEAEYMEVDAEILLGADGEVPVYGASMVQIVGRVRRSDQAALARAMAKFWRSNEGLLMVRNATVSEEIAAAERREESFVPKTLPELVGESIQSTPYREAYDEAVRRVDEPSSGC